jgi:acyl carrier protein
MNRDECFRLIANVYKDFVPPEQIPPHIDDETRVFGGDSPLDSAGLVSLVVEIEQQVNEAAGTNIVIADDRAMSQKRSPFRSLGALTDHVHGLLREHDHG